MANSSCTHLQNIQNVHRLDKPGMLDRSHLSGNRRLLWVTSEHLHWNLALRRQIKHEYVLKTKATVTNYGLSRIENVWSDDGAEGSTGSPNTHAHVSDHSGHQLRHNQIDESKSASNTNLAHQGEDLQHNCIVWEKQTWHLWLPSRFDSVLKKNKKSLTFRNQFQGQESDAAEHRYPGQQSGSRRPVGQQPNGHVGETIDGCWEEAVEVDVSIQVTGVERQTVKHQGNAHPEKHKRKFRFKFYHKQNIIIEHIKELLFLLWIK